METDYAERLHISRTPLREALRKLERDGLVEYVLRRGVVVRAFTIEDVDVYKRQGLAPMGNLSCTMRKLRCCATSKSSISINSAWACASLSCYSRPCHRGDAGSPSV